MFSYDPIYGDFFLEEITVSAQTMSSNKWLSILKQEEQSYALNDVTEV